MSPLPPAPPRTVLPGPFPELEANFVPLPSSLIDLLLKGNLNRQELLVTLFLGRATYELGGERTFVSLADLAQGTALPEAAASEAIDQAITRGTVLPFDAPGTGRFFLLNTVQNRNIHSVGSSSSADETDNSPPPAPSPAPSPSMAPPPARPPMTFADATVTVTPPPMSLASSAPAAGAGPRSGTPGYPTGIRSVPRRVVDRLVKLLGRDMTRDETERMNDLAAPEELLMQAVDNVVAKNIEVYSSDLIVYEYESIASVLKRKDDELKKRQATDQARTRQKGCKRCSGLGYTFLGASTIKECECRKTNV